jgi:hypothetical protein
MVSQAKQWPRGTQGRNQADPGRPWTARSDPGRHEDGNDLAEAATSVAAAGGAAGLVLVRAAAGCLFLGAVVSCGGHGPGSPGRAATGTAAARTAAAWSTASQRLTTAADAGQLLSAAITELTGTLDRINKAELTCDGVTSCDGKMDRETAAAFAAFAGKLAAITVPASERALDRQVSAGAAALERDYAKTGQATSAAQYVAASSTRRLRRSTIRWRVP